MHCTFCRKYIQNQQIVSRTFLASLLTCVVIMAGCGGALTRSGAVAPGKRALYGKSSLPVWSPLTAWEEKVLARTSEAQQGDPEALLDLALVASGDIRTKAAAAPLKRKVAGFITRHKGKLKRVIDPWHRAKKLHKLMHKEFLKESDTLKGYKAPQSKLSTLLKTGRYNCISSTILFVILCRYLGFNAQGVILPSHAFAQITFPDGKVVEAETTNTKGYGLVHNRKFYRENSSVWARLRGLSNTSYQDYQRRRIKSPLMLIHHNMNNQHTNQKRMDALHRNRLRELRAYITPGNRETSLDRLNLYIAEHNYMTTKKYQQNLLRFHKKTAPIVAQAQKQWSTDAEVLTAVGWGYSNNGIARAAAKHWKNALFWADRLLLLLGHPTNDRKNLLGNALFIVVKRIDSLIEAGNFKAATDLQLKYMKPCNKVDWCKARRHSAFGMWGSFYFKQQDWSKAIKKYAKGLSLAVDKSQKTRILGNIEASYHNWSLIYQRKQDWSNAAKIFKDCITHFQKAQKCEQEYKEMKKR
jgi:tetratricopeptide (TPR) repeat protein